MTDAVGVRIGARDVGPGHACLVIPEIGVNHNGDPALAARMIDAIADAGAECVKFQTFSADEFVNSAEDTYTYISQGEDVTESMLAMFRRLELRRDEFDSLFSHARRRNLVPFSTPTDRAAVDLLDDLGVPVFKIGSDDLVYTPFLRYVASKGKPLVLSTGMADEEDIERALDSVRAEGNDRVILLHCVSEYPTPPSDANLRKIPAMQARFGVPVGFSDHTLGVTAALGAVALGACIVEKHFTLDRSLPGPDHRFSTTPAELARLIADIHELEDCLGSAELIPTPAERETATLSRRSIVVAADLPAGHVLTPTDLAFRRPGTGLLPYEVERVLGRVTRRSLASGTCLSLDALEDEG